MQEEQSAKANEAFNLERFKGKPIKSLSAVKNDLKIDPDSVKISFIGNIRDLTNDSVKSILGCIYYIDTTDADMIISKSTIFQYKWYTIHELVDRYNKATSWSKKIIDCLLDKTIKIN